MTHASAVDPELVRGRGSRVVQIPLEWPMRYGSVLAVSADNPPTALCIAWDDGRQEWVRDEDLVSLSIWLVSDEEKRHEPTPLQYLLDAIRASKKVRGSRAARRPDGAAAEDQLVGFRVLLTVPDRRGFGGQLERSARRGADR